jgi:hypothetical protein
MSKQQQKQEAGWSVKRTAQELQLSEGRVHGLIKAGTLEAWKETVADTNIQIVMISPCRWRRTKLPTTSGAAY